MRGRKPPGPEFVHRLEGAEDEKKRLEVILQTLSGQLSINEASALLEVTPQRFHMLREKTLQAAVEALAPGQPGRPRKVATPEQARLAALEEENERLRQELEASRLREEIALLLPGRQGRIEKKKGESAGRGRRGRRRRR